MFARLVLCVLLATACEKTSHENIDKWMHTEKGPGKLKKTVADESIDPDLSAHAAANMIMKGMDPDVRTALEQMTVQHRTQVIAKLAPRLWNIARIEGDMTMPSPPQVAGKDALVSIRKWADDAGKQQIDQYLIDWYCVSSYEGRAQVGAVLGAAVLRMVGPPAAKKMIEVANGVIAAPGQDKVKNRIGDELMVGLAVTGSPEAVKYVLDLAKMNRGDETLPKRAMGALTRAYVDPGGMFDAADPAPLVGVVDELAALAKDEGTPKEAATDSLALIRAAGPPACIAPLIGLISLPHSNRLFKYATAEKALTCGGTKVIKDVVRALPDVAYDHEELVGGIASVVGAMSPRDQVLAAMRELLDDKSRVARWVAIETLAWMKSAEDAPRVAAVKSSDKLSGFWGGDPSKPEPTLGQRATELAAQLQKGGK